MADGHRVYPVNLVVMHHAVSDPMNNWTDSRVRRWFSDIGRNRGYKGVAHSNHYVEGYETFAQAQFCLHPYTADGNKYGWRLTQLMDDPFNNVAWHAGNWAINQRSIGIETAGNWLNALLPEKALMLVADTFREHDKNIGGTLNVTYHRMYSSTQCPGRIAEQVGTIIDMINNPAKWNNILWPVPAPTPTPVPVPVPNPTPAPSPAVKSYTRFEFPKLLVANKKANLWDFNKSGWSFPVIKSFNQGDEFIAVGQANHSNGGTYYMTEYSFGKADTTGIPNNTWGVNQADLSPKPEPTPQPVPEPTPTPEPEPQPTPEPSPEPIPTPEPPVNEEPGGINKYLLELVNWIVSLIKAIFSRKEGDK